MQTIDPDQERWGGPIASPAVPRKRRGRRRRGGAGRRLLEMSASDKALLEELWLDWKEPEPV